MLQSLRLTPISMCVPQAPQKYVHFALLTVTQIQLKFFLLTFYERDPMSLDCDSEFLVRNKLLHMRKISKLIRLVPKLRYEMILWFSFSLIYTFYLSQKIALTCLCIAQNAAMRLLTMWVCGYVSCVCVCILVILNMSFKGLVYSSFYAFNVKLFLNFKGLYCQFPCTGAMTKSIQFNSISLKQLYY